MKKHSNLALALIAGLLGGLLSRYIAPPAAFAQNQPPIQPVPNDRPITPIQIRAWSFEFTDTTGRRVLGMLRFEGDHVVLRDSGGREIWTAGGSPFRLPSEQ